MERFSIKDRVLIFKKYFFLRIILLSFFPLIIHSQNSVPRFEHISVKDGLPENSVKAILQDYLGYLWFGTQNGLVKYDGYEMNVYQNEEKNEKSLSSNSISTIYEDHKKDLWIGTWDAGLNRFNRATETFDHFVHNSKDSSSISANMVYSIYEDRKGRLWIGTDNGLNLFDRKTNKFEHYYFSDKKLTMDLNEILLTKLKDSPKIASILQVGNNDNITKKFTIKKQCTVLIVMIGEAGYDYGWLEDSNGNVVFDYNYKYTYHAGGDFINRIQIEIAKLNVGIYKLHFKSNYYYSFGDKFSQSESYDYKLRVGEKPSFDEDWGIQIIDVSGDDQGLGELLKETPDITMGSRVFSVSECKKTGKIYIGTNSPGLWELDNESKTIKKVDFSGYNQLPKELGSVESFYTANNGSFWIATTTGLCNFDPSKRVLYLYQPLPSEKSILANHMHSLSEDKEGNIWIATVFNGIVKFDIKQKTFKIFENDPIDPHSLSRNDVLSLTHDRSGILWVGTWTGGIDKWDKIRWKFHKYKINSVVENSILQQNINTICENEKGILWIGNNNGLFRYDVNSNQIKRFSHSIYDPKSISSDSVTYIIRDPFTPHNLWIGTLNGLNRFNMLSEKFESYLNHPSDFESISNNYVTEILIDKRANLWVGTRGGGLNQFFREKNKFSCLKDDPDRGFILKDNFVTAIYEDSSGNIWFGHNGVGLNKLEYSKEKYHYRYLNFNDDKLLCIKSIYKERNGNFWLGTFMSGLFLVDVEEGKIIYNYTTKNGLLDNQVCSIIEDELGCLWFSNNIGLTRYCPENGKFNHYGISEGLINISDLSSNTLYKGSDGKIFFCGKEGFNVFYPRLIIDDPTPPQVIIKKISLFNHPGEKFEYKGFISKLKELSLSYNQNDLSFQYVGFHYGEPLKNQYKYILEGFDENWIDAGNQRIATYTNLNPGEYIFRVTGANRDGVWNEKSTSIKIIILPPWWQTSWAYLLYILSIAGIIYLIWKTQLKRIRIKHEFEMSKFEAQKLHEVDEMKSRFFANISHEFRTPLTLIIGPAKDVLDSTKETKTKQNVGLIKRNASRLLGLVNQLLDLSKLEAGKMTLSVKEANIIPFLKGLVLSFSSFAERKNITLNFHTNEEKVMVFFDKDKIEKIINNLLSNAFKFTHDGGKIDVKVEKMIKELEIRISDSGIGIPEDNFDKIFDRFYQVDGSHTREQEGTGIGLALTKELVELHKGKIEVKSETGKGTTFIVRIPLGKDQIKPEEIVEEKVREEDQVPKVDTELTAETTVKRDQINIDMLLETDKPLLLVVEDNSDVRKYIISHLEDIYRIQEAVDGEDGLEQALNHIPDLVISDVMMPKMDGFEMCNKIKTDERTSHIPIIMLTAKATSQDKISGYEIGADDYIMKPFDAAELKVRIKNLIEIRRKLQEKFRSADFVVPSELSLIDEQFMKRVLNVINEHISEEEFSIDELGKEVAMSRQHLYRKLKAISGKSPSLFIRSVKLAKAKKLIKERKGTISEISFQVGFNSPAYFNKCFKEEFGYSPREFTQ